MCKAKKYVKEFIDLNNNMRQDFNVLLAQQSLVDLYEQDLLHVLEKSNFNASEGYILSKMISENRQKRRVIKNELQSLAILKSIFGNLDLVNVLDKTYKKVEEKDDILQNLSTNKIYNPRVINTTDIKVIVSNFKETTNGNKKENEGVESMKEKEQLNNELSKLLEMDNDYGIRLANYLCNTPQRLETFKEKFLDVDDHTLGQFMEFRRFLLESRETNINVKLLQECIDNKDWQMLYESLQELWLQPFNVSWMENYKRKINEGLNGQDMMNWHKRHTGSVLSILIQDIKYIKSFNNN